MLSSNLGTPVLVMIVTGILALLLIIWAFPRGNATSNTSDDERLKGWSNLDWTIKYDGYGEVGVENDSASLKPQAVQEPGETSAALALAGGSDWRDYRFTIQMCLQ